MKAEVRCSDRSTRLVLLVTTQGNVDIQLSERPPPQCTTDRFNEQSSLSIVQWTMFFNAATRYQVDS